MARSIKPDQAVVWGLPTLLIPTGRYLFADPKERRAELLVRDASTYAIGASLFFLVSGITNQLLKGKHYTASVIAGTLASIAFCVFGATRMSQFLTQKRNGQAVQEKIAPPSSSAGYLDVVSPAYAGKPPTRYASRQPYTAMNPAFESRQVLRRAETYSIFSGSS